MTKQIDSAATFALRLLDADGAPATGLTSASAGADFSFYQLVQGGLAKQALTLVASGTGDYDLTEVGDGWYDILIPAGDNDVTGLAWVDGKFTATVASQPVIEEVIDPTNSDKLDSILGIMTAGTAQAGGATSITLAAGDAAATNGYSYFGILLTGGTGAGQANLIETNDATSKVANVIRTWTTNPDATTAYLIIPAWVIRAFLQSGSVTSDVVATSAVDEIVDAVYEEDPADHVGADTFGELLGAVATSTEVSAVETKIDTIDTNVDAILVDTGTTLDGKLTTIEGKIDTVDTNVDSILVDTGTDIPATITTLTSDVADVQTDATAIRAVTTKVDTALVLDGAVYKYTSNALEDAPTGAGSGTTAQEVWEYATRGLTEEVDIAADQSAVTVGTVNTIAAGGLSAIANAVLGFNLASVTGEATRSLINAARMLVNKVTLDRTAGTYIVYEENDVTVAYQGTLGTTANSLVNEMDPD
jgi:hypothetical protein